jgi:hypothetical protein
MTTPDGTALIRELRRLADLSSPEGEAKVTNEWTSYRWRTPVAFVRLYRALKQLAGLGLAWLRDGIASKLLRVDRRDIELMYQARGLRQRLKGRPKRPFGDLDLY